MSEAFEHISPQGRQDLFIFGDHASRYIPPEFNNLGLSGDDLTRHIAWDIGTAQIIKRLCEHFKCGGQLAAVSRLVIDLNRDRSSAGLIPHESDETLISGNVDLSLLQKEARLTRFYAPYHAALAAELNSRKDPFVLSVHSFTPKPKSGPQRDTDIGLLVKHDVQSAGLFKGHIDAQDLGLKAEINKPYSAYDLNYTIDVHAAPRGLRHLAIEIRQDHVDSEAGVETISNLLISALEPLIRRAHIPIK